MRRRQRGGVMILTIVVLAAVMAVLAAALATENTEFRAAARRIDRLKARVAAESGIQYALAALQTEITAPVMQTDAWFTLGNNADERFTVGSTSFRMQVVDAASLISLNTATETQLQNLGLTTEQVDSLLDWREEGQTPRAEGGKDDYYATLANPYIAKLRRLDSLDELLLIKGFTAQSLLQNPEESSSTGAVARPLYVLATVDSFSPNSGANGQAKQNINAANQQQLTQAGIPQQLAAAIIAQRQGGTFTTMGDVLRVPGMTNEAVTAILDNFAINTETREEGKINVNTATEDVLLSLPEMTPDVVQAILSRQAAGMQSLGELLQVPGITVQSLAGFVDRVAIGSDTFLVRVEGTSGSARYPLEAVIRLTGTSAKVVKVLDPPLDDMRELWGWAEDTTTETALGEDR
ncbi:MAG: general secretion pathway protein GspK [Fimbriimonadaceae bacterium]|nr:general secretion pathway protein GspK [Fimbriimonadaceae bacterium]